MDGLQDKIEDGGNLQQISGQVAAYVHAQSVVHVRLGSKLTHSGVHEGYTSLA